MNSLLSLCLFTVVGSLPTEPLIDDIVQHGHRRVAVIPSVLHRRSDEELTIGSLGPRARTIATDVYRQLVNQSRKRFEVVPERVVRGEMRRRGFSVIDLDDARRVQELAASLRADSLITLSYVEHDDPGPRADQRIQYEVIDIHRNVTSGTNTMLDQMNLSKAAYQGESWELRRWVKGRLENRAFDLANNQEFGFGPAWERYQYARLRPGLRHPQEISDFPFPVRVTVVGESTPRDPIRINRGRERFYVVPLEPSEQYEIRLRNDSGRNVYAVVYVDGVSVLDTANTTGQTALEPTQLADNQMWRLNPGKWSLFEGWTGRASPGARLTVNRRFMIAPRNESVAYGQGFGDRVGQITVIFYTVGLIDVPQPATSQPARLTSKGLDPATLGTTQGDVLEREITTTLGEKRGLMLAAVTYHYRSFEETQRMQDELTGGDNTGSEYVTTPSQPPSPQVEDDSELSLIDEGPK